MPNFFNWGVAPDITAALKINLEYEKRKDIWHLVLLRKNILFKESPTSIMITRNHSFETRPGHWLGLVTGSRVRWVDPGQQKKIQAYHLENENILDQQIPTNT